MGGEEPWRGQRGEVRNRGVVNVEVKFQEGNKKVGIVSEQRVVLVSWMMFVAVEQGIGPSFEPSGA